MNSRSCLLFFIVYFLSSISYAATLFGIVSDRSATELAAGAAQFNKDHPGHKLIIRTPSQLAKLTDNKIANYIKNSDAILLAAVFGDSVIRVERLFKKIQLRADVPVFATNSDDRITRLSHLNGTDVFKHIDTKTLRELAHSPNYDVKYSEHIVKLANQYPEQSQWLEVRKYWQGRGSHNMAGLIGWLLHRMDHSIQILKPQEQSAIRYYHQGRVKQVNELKFNSKPVTIILDHNTGDRAGDRDLLDAVCQQAEKQNQQCLAILARWGEASMQAIKTIAHIIKPAKASIMLSLQDFAIGGGLYRKKVTKLLTQLNIPVIKGIRLTDRTQSQWQLSTDGIPWDGVHYRVAMPELQGISQPMILATAQPAYIDKLTGLKLAPSKPVIEQVKQVTSRMNNWVKLQQKNNSQKHVAIIYYNHPPGRHNIGADNLDVPASLFHVLQQLKQAGYNTGKLPNNENALLDLIQQQGINLPNDQAALKNMATKVINIKPKEYQNWFNSLPLRIQNEVTYGPLGYLKTQLFKAVETNEHELAKMLLNHIGNDIEHLLEGVDHPARARAVDLFHQFKSQANALLQNKGKAKETRISIEQLMRALHATGIEGLRGWGDAPGNVMTHKGKMLVPGIQFGNIFIGPQPPRGWEVNEELLHANLAFPPTHQYLGFYYWIKHHFKADALVHLGRHSTYEFLPQRRVGLTQDDYPSLIASDIPGIYPYIVDGVGEGIQAKRRGLAVMIDHLTPPLNATPLYDELLTLRQLVESYESAQEKSPARQRTVNNIRKLIDKMKLKNDLESIMKDEIAIRGISFEQIDDEMLVHEVGHYLTQIQEQFMPLGLHIFGKDWEQTAIKMMLNSINQPKNKALPQLLSDSPKHEGNALLAALNGQFIAPGKGNDPIRTPEALPTGRNFHALDSSLIPSRIGYELGLELANQTRKETEFKPEGREAVILWASDTVRDEGVMVAFGLDMLGIQPVWNSRGKFKGLKRLTMTKDRVRRDTVFTTSGLFRDLYADLLIWLDRAVLLALDGANNTIIKTHPELTEALNAALQPIAEIRAPGNESLSVNQVAAHWVEETKQLLKQHLPAAQAGRQASLRLFGDAPGSYGAGVNRMTERSASWDDRQQISKAYLNRMGHAYGEGLNGIPAHKSFAANLKNVQNTYLGRSSNLYGLMDNNDAFDYMGGLSMVVESLSGKIPNNRVIQHADPKNAKLVSLDRALLQELRGQFLNPAWLKGLMKHDYAGARTMGSEFMEYLWGWQVTNPEIIKSWIWDEVKDVYINDKHNLGLDEFLEQGHNVHIKTNMLAIMLVAAHKGFWQTDEETLKQLSDQFSKLVAEHGLPGSGHTQPDHPMLDWIKDHIDLALAKQLTEVRNLARGEVKTTANTPISIAELDVTNQEPETVEKVQQAHKFDTQNQIQAYFLILIALIIIAAGVLHGRRQFK